MTRASRRDRGATLHGFAWALGVLFLLTLPGVPGIGRHPGDLPALHLTTKARPGGIVNSRSGDPAVAVGGPGALPALRAALPPKYTVSFSISPAGCGPLAFNGSSQADGSLGSYLAGTYSAVADPCSNYTFRQWNSTGGVLVPRNTSAGNPVNVTGNGSLTAWYAWSGKRLGNAGVSFVISPAGCGPLTFGGLHEASGTSGTFATGNYSAYAPSCPGYAFPPRWSVTGALRLPSLLGDPTTVDVLGNGTLTAAYTLIPPPAYHTIRFQVAPTVCAPVSFNGSLQASGSSAPFLNGLYPMHALPCGGYTFSLATFAWAGGGRSQLLSSPWGNVSVSTNGTLWVNYTADKYTVGFGVQPALCGPILFNGTVEVDGSTAPFRSGVYPAGAPACSGHPFANWTFVNATGARQVLSTAWANVSLSTNATLTAYYATNLSPLNVTLQASATTVPAGASVTLTPTVVGGSAPYSCRWALNGTNTSQSGCAALSLPFAHPGNYTYRVWATDSRAVVAGSPAVTVPVTAPTPPLVVTLTANVRTLYAGGSVTLALTWTPGDCPCHLSSWALNSTNDSALATVSPLQVFLPQAGNYSFQGWVVESHGQYAVSAPVSVSVLPQTASPSNPRFSVLGLSTTMSLLLILVAVGVIGGVVGVVMWQRKMREARTSPGPPPPPY